MDTSYLQSVLVLLDPRAPDVIVGALFVNDSPIKSCHVFSRYFSPVPKMSEHTPSTNSLPGSREGDWPSTSESSYEILQRAAHRVASSGKSYQCSNILIPADTRRSLRIALCLATGALNLPLDPFWKSERIQYRPQRARPGLDHLAEASPAQQLTAGGISGW